MSFAPLIWKGFSLKDREHEQLFIGQVSDLLNFLNSAQGLATLLNGQSLLGASALSLVGTDLGVITTNQTIAAAQAASVMAKASVSTVFSPTITFTNLAVGAPVSMRFSNNSGSPVTLKFAATSPTGSAYIIFAFSTTAVTNMVTTGLSVGAGTSAMFSGASYAGPELDLLVNVT
jgi:hypothetical protein